MTEKIRKGLLGHLDIAIDDIARMEMNLLREDCDFPVCILQLYSKQIDDDAWQINLSTPCKIQVARQARIQRIGLTNQLAGKNDIAVIVNELDKDDDYDIYYLMDSNQGVNILEDQSKAE